MNTRKLFGLIGIMVVLLLALPLPVSAQGPGGNDSPIIFGSNYTLPANQVIKDLVVFGGNAILEAGSTVTGDVVIFGGNLVISGEVKGDVTDFGGDVILTEKAMVRGDLNTLGGTSQMAPGATVLGKRVTGIGAVPLHIPTQIYTPAFYIDFGPSASLLSAIFSALILALLAVLVALFLPTPTSRVAQTIGTQPLISGAIGLLTLVVTPALFLVLAITVILIPLGLIGLLIFGIALLFGWVAIGLELGKNIAHLFKMEWAVPVSAGVGTLLLSLVTNMTLALTSEWFWLLCCIGFPLVGLVMMVGLGAVVTSKFGAQVYQPNANRPPAAYPPSVPLSPVPPASGTLQAPPAPVPPPPPAGWTPPDAGQMPPAPPASPEPPQPPNPDNTPLNQ